MVLLLAQCMSTQISTITAKEFIRFLYFLIFIVIKIIKYFKYTTGEYDGGHAIRLIGWGTQTCDGVDQPFWIAVNSWDVEWGMNGLFLIAQGNDECHIESMGISFGTPKIY